MFLLLFILNSQAYANGVSFEAAIGYPEVSLQNPNSGEAVYSGIAVSGKLYAPIYVAGSFSSNFTFSGRYLDLNNNSNSNAQRETGNHIGLGGGLRFKIHKIVLGANYHLIKARHFWVGSTTNDYKEYDYGLFSYYAGLEWLFSKNFGLSMSYESAAANIEIENNPVPYSENTIWLHFRFDTGMPFWGFLGSLFK